MVEGREGKFGTKYEGGGGGGSEEKREKGKRDVPLKGF